MNILSSLVNVGTEHTNNRPEAFRLKSVNVCCLLAIIVIIGNNSLFLLLGVYPIPYLFIFFVSAIPFGIVLWLHSKGKFYSGGLITTIVPYAINVFAYYISGAGVHYEVFFLVLSISTFVTIYNSSRFTALFFGLYMLMFLIAVFSNAHADVNMDAIAKERINNFVYAISAFMFPLLCYIIYRLNELSLLELKDREHRLLGIKRELERSDQLRSAFLSNMSHEIRTPMNSIVGFSNLLAKENLNQQQQQYAEIIDKGSKQLLNIVNDVLDMSKIETGHVDIVYEELHLSGLMQDLYNLFTQNATAKKLELKLIPSSIGNRKLRTRTDAQKVRQVLSNLLSNAIKFTDSGSVSFGFKLSPNRKFIDFFVEDTGIGIPSAAKEKVFDRFQQLEQGEENLIKGTGLGLAISKAYTEMLEGKLTLNSKKGKGTTFHLHIPLDTVQTAQKPTIETNKSDNLIRACKILLAEDVKFNTLLMKKLIEDTPAQLHCVEDGAEAIKYAKEQADIDLVLMDIKMPVIGGEEAMQKIKAFRPELPIIALTAFSMNEEKHALLKEGFDGFVSKPVQRKELIQAINNCLSTKH